MDRKPPLRRALTALVLAALLALGGCGEAAAPAAGGRDRARTVRAVPAQAAPAPVPILMYHDIGDPPPRARLPSLWVTPAQFAAQVRALRRAGYRGVTLRQVWDAWHGGTALPRKPVVVSFDDGYAAQVRAALPVLRGARWRGVLNLSFSHLPRLGGTHAVHRLVRAGWEIDSHSLTHRDLTRLPAAQLRRELVESRARIARLFGQPASFFCYPSGRYDPRVVAAVRDAGYLAATTVRPGLATLADDPYALPRVPVLRGMTASRLLRRLRALR